MTGHNSNEALRALLALGHAPAPTGDCTAMVKPRPASERPPGPVNPPIWCCLKLGHEGPHRYNGGGMYPSIPFRATDEIEHRRGFDVCAKCRVRWPCMDAQMVFAAFAPPSPAEDAFDDWAESNLTDGSGHAPASVWNACAEAFGRAWPQGRKAAETAAAMILASHAPPEPALATPAAVVESPTGHAARDWTEQERRDATSAMQRIHDREATPAAVGRDAVIAEMRDMGQADLVDGALVLEWADALTPRPEAPPEPSRAQGEDPFVVFAKEVSIGAYRPAEAAERARELLTGTSIPVAPESIFEWHEPRAGSLQSTPAGGIIRNAPPTPARGGEDEPEYFCAGCREPIGDLLPDDWMACHRCGCGTAERKRTAAAPEKNA